MRKGARASCPVLVAMTSGWQYTDVEVFGFGTLEAGQHFETGPGRKGDEAKNAKVI